MIIKLIIAIIIFISFFIGIYLLFNLIRKISSWKEKLNKVLYKHPLQFKNKIEEFHHKIYNSKSSKEIYKTNKELSRYVDHIAQALYLKQHKFIKTYKGLLFWKKCPYCNSKLKNSSKIINEFTQYYHILYCENCEYQYAITTFDPSDDD